MKTGTSLNGNRSPASPGEHRAAAEAALDAMRPLSPGTPAYTALAQAAIAHVLCAIAEYLEPELAPAVPGLPPGWQLAVHQNPAGHRLWAYVITPPPGSGLRATASRHLWGSSPAALAAEVAAAEGRAATLAASENTTVSTNQEGSSS